VPARKAKKWDIQVVTYDSGGKPPTLTANGVPSGTVKPEDIDKLLDALGAFAQQAGAKLNALKVTPSEFTIEGHVALQVSGNVFVLQFGVETGLSISMTWRFEDSTVQIAPLRRKSPPAAPAEPTAPPVS
jgi:hypothetical protein